MRLEYILYTYIQIHIYTHICITCAHVYTHLKDKYNQNKIIKVFIKIHIQSLTAQNQSCMQLHGHTITNKHCNKYVSLCETEHKFI